VNIHNDLTAVILAGGRGHRMNDLDKGLLLLDGRPLVRHVVDAFSRQVPRMLVNANRNAAAYAALGFPVFGDELEGYQGPLAGFLAGLNRVETPDALFLPCDTPFLKPVLVDRLREARDAEQAEIAVAHDGRRLQSVCAIVPVRLAASLRAYLDAGDRKIDLWYARHRVAVVDFPDEAEMFVNVNTPNDLRALDGTALD
jgi:molybdenum cofactor guanylyltransferase